jgi:hypothetical protein
MRFSPSLLARCGVPLLLLLTACRSELADADLGALSLSLTTQAGGVTYQLTDARFSLKGPESKGFASGEEESLTLEVTPGAYTLELLDGWHLVQADDPELKPVAARLISENPAPLLVESDATSEAVLRFELADGTQLSNGKGKLSVAFTLDSAADGGAASEVCSAGLRISEVDYDQPSADDSEFVEVVNTSDCEAQLSGVVLELLNGSDGKVYARYELDTAGSSLAAYERLLVGDPSVLTGLPAERLALPLNGSGMQNGPDGVRLMLGERVLDALAYEGAVPGLSEGQASGADDAERAFGRCPDGFDSEQNSLDFRLLTPTPGTPNACE